jgi:hypothetical protein
MYATAAYACVCECAAGPCVTAAYAAAAATPPLLLRLTFQPASTRGVDAGFLTVGQFDLGIPPGQANYVARTATCTPGCTKRCVLGVLSPGCTHSFTWNLWNNGSSWSRLGLHAVLAVPAQHVSSVLHACTCFMRPPGICDAATNRRTYVSFACLRNNQQSGITRPFCFTRKQRLLSVKNSLRCQLIPCMCDGIPA